MLALVSVPHHLQVLLTVPQKPATVSVDVIQTVTKDREVAISHPVMEMALKDRVACMARLRTVSVVAMEMVDEEMALGMGMENRVPRTEHLAQEMVSKDFICQVYFVCVLFFKGLVEMEMVGQVLHTVPLQLETDLAVEMGTEDRAQRTVLQMVAMEMASEVGMETDGQVQRTVLQMVGMVMDLGVVTAMENQAQLMVLPVPAMDLEMEMEMEDPALLTAPLVLETEMDIQTAMVRRFLCVMTLDYCKMLMDF